MGRLPGGPPAPSQALTERQAAERLSALLDRLGFEPETETRAEGPKAIRLRHCPFLELAEEHGSLVCSVHLGLMRGALAEVDAPLTVAGLEPFAEADTCLTHLEPASAG